MKQTCILVLGMHRSGTSALTGMLNICDVYLGDKLMEANFANKKGYFENSGLYTINEKLLSQIDSSWDDVFFNEDKMSKVLDTSELKSFIKKEFEYSNLFAIKDPRLVFLFPVYKQVLLELDIDIKIIIPYRNPLEVASSLKKRDDFSMEKGMLLWAYHLLLAEKSSRGVKRFFVEFNDLLASPDEVVKAIDKNLHLNLHDTFEKNNSEISEFIEPNLKHHNISLDNLSSNTPEIVKNILKLRTSFNTKSIITKFDILIKELFSYQKIFYNQNILDSFSELKESNKTLHVKNQEIEKQKAKEAELNKTLHVKNQEIEKQKAKEAELNKTLHVKNQEIEKQKAKETELNKTLHVKNEEIENLKDELVMIYTSRSWKTTRIFRKFNNKISNK